jgi:hypothetical protein
MLQSGVETEDFSNARIWHKFSALTAAENSLPTGPGIISKEGVSFYPLSMAAWQCQAAESTLKSWIDKGVKFNRRSIETYESSISGDLYISEISVKNIAGRFQLWPSGKPAGTITLGETDDDSGYISFPDAARMVGVSKRTLTIWVSKHNSTSTQPYHVVRDPISDRLYILHSDIFYLKNAARPVSEKPGPKPKSPSL